MNGLEFVIIIVFLSMVKGTVNKYLDYRIRIADRQVGSGDRSVLRAIEEVRAEVAALRRHETDAILSFDSTLQTLDARLKNVERRGLDAGVADRSPLSGATQQPVEEPARAVVTGGGLRSTGAP